jgi:hypothetical protein
VRHPFGLRCRWCVLCQMSSLCRAGSSPILLQPAPAVNSLQSAQSRVVGYACREARELENNQRMPGYLRTNEIAASLVDLETGRPLSAEGLTNHQSAYGEDVIASMSYAKRGSTEAGCCKAWSPKRSPNSRPDVQRRRAGRGKGRTHPTMPSGWPGVDRPGAALAALGARGPLIPGESPMRSAWQAPAHLSWPNPLIRSHPKRLPATTPPARRIRNFTLDISPDRQYTVMALGQIWPSSVTSPGLERSCLVRSI